MMSSSDPRSLFPSPASLSSFRGRKVKLSGQREGRPHPHVGLVLAVDPIGAGFVLAEETRPSSSADFSLELVPHVKLETVETLEDNEATREARLRILACLSQRRIEALQRKREAAATASVKGLDLQTVVEALERHQLSVKVVEPASETSDLSVLDGLVTVGFPYSSDTCSSTNGVVLNRVKSLLETLATL